MSSSKPNENRLFLTNNYSIISKYSASIKGYFKDPLLEDLIQHETEDDTKPAYHRTALINRGYAARQMAVEWIVDRSLRLERLDCILILGAGFDTLSLRPRDVSCHWIEIDLPYVIDFKRNYIGTRINSSENDVIISANGNVTSFMSLKIHLISCDIRDQNDLSEKLSLVFNNIHQDERRRVAVLNEVCLCYLERFEVRQIFETLKSLFSQSAQALHYIGFEQVNSHESSHFANVMRNHFEYIGFPLKNFPTRRELLDLFRNQLNFNHLTISSMFQIYHNANFENRLSFADLEPFDEYEELDLYLSHYALVTGVVYLKPVPTGDFSPSGSSTDKTADALYDDLCGRLNMIQLDRQHNLTMGLNESIRRYAHSSCVVIDEPCFKVALVCSGFGKFAEPNMVTNRPSNPNQHQRLNECIAVNWDSAGQAQTRRIHDDSGLNLALDCMYGQVCYLGDGIVCFNGGRRSPQRSVSPNNNSYLVGLDRQNLKLMWLKGIFVDNPLRWRHKILRLEKHKLIQIGGLWSNPSKVEGDIGFWDWSNDKYGYHPISLDETQNRLLERHTFGMDLRDDNTLLVFGGLKASGLTDQPVDSSHSVILLDLRTPNSPSIVECHRPSYDSQVHFIDAYKFVKIGGISTNTGLPEDLLEVYDLRSNRGLPIASEPLPSIRRDADSIFIPTKMTSVHFKESREIISIGGGGNYFTFGTHFNERHVLYKYSQPI